MAPGNVGRQVRYDGIADWYDGQVGDAAARRGILIDLLGPGQGLSLDVGCGTGRDLETIAQTGRTPIGLDLSADQLRLAASRWPMLVQADAERLPFRAGSFATVTSLWTSTDVDDFNAMMHEAGRVLTSGGKFLFYGVHPCFNGPGVQSQPDGTRVVHPIYRAAERHFASPWWARAASGPLSVECDTCRSLTW